MKIKISELVGPPLDWAVARCQYPKSAMSCTHVWILTDPFSGEDDFLIEKYSTDWAQGGPIIEREFIELHTHSVNDDGIVAWRANDYMDGPTLLIAAMRCYVAQVLGQEVDIPQELT